MREANPTTYWCKLCPACAVTLFLFFSCFATACGQQVAPEKLAVINTDIAAIESEIRTAEAEEAKYEGGLVKALCSARLAILRQTHAMLQQRSKSWTFGTGLKYTVDGKPFVLPSTAKADLAAVEQELASLETKIKSQEAEAARYSGGLVYAMALSTLATMRQTQAMLEQRRLALKYELPQYVAFAAENKSAPPIHSREQDSTAATDSDRDWEIVSIDTRVTESNEVWWKYAWRLTLKNSSDRTQVFRATIEFQDSDGFIVDSDESDVLAVPARSEQTFTGYDLVNAEVARKVARTSAKVRKARQ